MPYKLIAIILLFFGGEALAQKKTNIPKPLELAIKKGDYRVISSYFNTNVELSVLGVDNIYSQSQAKYVLKKFFEENETRNFIVDHQGNKINTSHFAGTLTTEKGKYKVIILLKDNQQGTKLHQLKIENE